MNYGKVLNGKVLNIVGLCFDFAGAAIMSWYYLFLTEGKAAKDGALYADGGDSQIESLINQANSIKLGFAIIALGFILHLIASFLKEQKSRK